MLVAQHGGHGHVNQEHNHPHRQGGDAVKGVGGVENPQRHVEHKHQQQLAQRADCQSAAPLFGVAGGRPQGGAGQRDADIFWKNGNNSNK